MNVNDLPKNPIAKVGASNVDLARSVQTGLEAFHKMREERDDLRHKLDTSQATLAEQDRHLARAQQERDFYRDRCVVVESLLGSLQEALGRIRQANGGKPKD